eukprot:2164302-Pyramimonas_sp.AAC.1
MGAREAEETKYEDTLEGLRKDGREPVLYIGISIGTLGEMPCTAAAAPRLRPSQVKGIRFARTRTRSRSLDDLHMIAV